MKYRCDLHVNGASRKLLLVAGLTETPEHLALKLAAFLLYWEHEPIVEASTKHPSLLGQEFTPDLVAFDETGAVKLWVECGKTALHKLGKLVRRYPDARIVVLRATEGEAKRFRTDIAAEIERHARIEIRAWPAADFKTWLGALRREKVEVYGEAGDNALNLVVNETAFAVHFGAF
ncbi:MAG: YaeQ family protein [Elusimicrobiota bacterium]|jgi:uncharacterized protein YaeQ